jgi:hypothetical protein
MSTKKQKLMQLLSNNELLIDDKIKYIKRFPLFFNLPENFIPILAKISSIEFLNKEKFLTLYGNNKDYVVLIMKGMLKYSATDTEEKIFAKNDIIIRGINLDNFATKLQALSDVSVIKFERKEFFNTIISNKEIVRHILSEASQLTWIVE